MAEFQLRRAVEADSVPIRELIHLVRINPIGLDWKRFIVAVAPQGQVIGCGQLKPHGADVLELASIAVQPDYRKQGVARAVIEHLLARSPRPLYLTCRSRLGPFYEKFGFQALTSNEMPRYFRRIQRLAGMVNALARSGESLLVMKLK